MGGRIVTETGISAPGIYFQWGDFLIKIGNLIVIVLIVAFRRGHKRGRTPGVQPFDRRHEIGCDTQWVEFALA